MIISSITVFVVPGKPFLLGLVLLFLSLYMFSLYIDLRINPSLKLSYSSRSSLIIVGIINFVIGLIILFTH